jgi:sec-independent protein translocase protein TatA
MLSIPDMALLGAAALMFFGPEQLPKVARKVGLLVRDVQNTSQTFIREMERAADDHDGADVARAHLLDEPKPYVPDPYPVPEPWSASAPYVPPEPHADEPHNGAPHDVATHEDVAHETVAHEAVPGTTTSAGHEPAP